MENGKMNKQAKKKFKKYCKYDYVYCIQKIRKSEGGGFRAWIPQLGSDLFQEHGDTVDEALGKLELLKEDLLRRYIREGLKLPQPKIMNKILWGEKE